MFAKGDYNVYGIAPKGSAAIFRNPLSEIFIRSTLIVSETFLQGFFTRSSLISLYLVMTFILSMLARSGIIVFIWKNKNFNTISKYIMKKKNEAYAYIYLKKIFIHKIL
jgi:hypothetical protein